MLTSLVLPVPTGDSSAGSYLRCSSILEWGRDRYDKRAVSYHATLVIVACGCGSTGDPPETRASGGRLVSMCFFFHIGTIKLS